MAGETDRYLEARAAFARSSAEMDGVANTLQEVGVGLREHRSKFHFSNVPTGLPMEAVMNPRSPTVDANRWLTADQIQQALARWHAARTEMTNAWSAIPRDIQPGLQPPL